MKRTTKNEPLSNPDFIRLSTYIPIAGYTFLAMLVRVVVLSTLMVLRITTVGWSIKWLALFCPVLIITLVLPMHFSFARALMTVAQGGSFSILQALRLTRYRKKLRASLQHALRIVFWGLPFFLMLGWLFYIIVLMDVVTTIRMLTSFGEIATSILSVIANFISGIFGRQSVLSIGGFKEGIYTISGITILTFLVFLWGIWRCSMYRYLWALLVSKSSNYSREMKRLLRKHKWKQLGCGFYNLFLWLPTLFFLFLVILSMYNQILKLLSALFETKLLEPILLPQGTMVLIAIGLFLHLLILPIRRSMTAYLVSYIHQKENS